MTTMPCAPLSYLVPASALAFVHVSAAQSDVGVHRDEVRAVVAGMLSDAEKRSSLSASSTDAGHDGKFFLAGSGGAFRLDVEGQMQARYIVSVRSNNADDDFDPGFELRRRNLKFSGTVHDNWFYDVQGGFSRSGGAFNLENAYAGYDFGNGLRIRWGQFKLPLLREELISSRRQIAVERSVMNAVFSQRRSQGLEVRYQTEDWIAAAAFSDGLRSLNSGFSHPRSADYGVTGRFEYKLAGDWGRFREFTARPGEALGALLGAAVHFQSVTTRPAGGSGSQSGNPTDVDTDSLTYTADLTLKGDRWNAFGAFVGRWQGVRGPADPGPIPSDSFNDFGAVVHAGYRIMEDAELFARWDAVWFDKDRDGQVNFHFLTVGANRYFAGHAAKLTVDVVIALNRVQDNLGAVTGAGILPDPNAGQAAVRVQFQLLF